LASHVDAAYRTQTSAGGHVLHQLATLDFRGLVFQNLLPPWLATEEGEQEAERENP
jgi:hypothetical protein